MAYTAKVRFSWDPAKDESNRSKHGLGFDEASELFRRSIDYLEIFDEAHSVSEERFIAIGPLVDGVVVVVFTEPDDDTIRILSARRATPREVALYQQHMDNT